MKSGLDLAMLDRSVRPQDDLFRFVNGRWLERTAVPPQRVWYGTFVELADRAEQDVRAIIEETTTLADRPRGSPAQQIADLYASMMDVAVLEKLGDAPIRPDLERIDGATNTSDLAAAAGYLSSIAAGGPFHGTVALDADSTTPVVHISQGGILLPDRDYYVDGAPRFVEIRQTYQAYLATIFRLSRRSDPDEDAKAVLGFETALARAHWSQVDSRDPAKTQNRYTLAQLASRMPGFDWEAWARPQGVDKARFIVLAQPSFFEAFAKLVSETPLATLKAWLASRYLTAMAPYLSEAFDLARFEFFGRTLTGQQAPIVRWRRGVSLVNGFLGDAIGRLYVEKHFPPAALARMRKLVDDTTGAFRQALAECEWLAPASRRAALEKLSRLGTKIGHPRQWRDYRRLDIRPDDLLGNVRRAQVFENQYRMARLDGPVDGGEWLVSPQTVNAYYHPGLNEIVLPAAILQPPLFDVGADDAANYGGIGAIIGHEIGHGFDERGRRYDGDGRPADWWTPRDEQAFMERARMLVEQFNAYSPVEGMRVNGALTLTENVGDLGGLAIAYRAYQISLGGRRAPVIDGFTGEQRFFLSWAQVWRAAMREEYLRQTLFSMVHAPAQYRTNGPVSNLEGFYEAFQLKPGDRLYREPAARVKIW
jgi:putative endopeptidase